MSPLWVLVMASHYGEFVARVVNQATKTITTGGWTALQVGSAPQKARRHLRIQVRAGVGGACALQYANGVDGSFTAPTSAAKGGTTIPGNTIHVEPVGDNVTVYGRLVKKKAFSDNSVQLTITEMS